ncbi:MULTISPECIES: hypothetical protein [Gordonia]|uniref:hypothetical protein n=1 Tax=Gordonia TaxID=2053 RepID=UPI0013A9B769|nr:MULTISPECIES: hypothetical protein [Gordonia]KAF0967985.1 hypothetical protein BPODLACK_03444 [Gordonia sp. YY1]UPW12061.1 hypothetical protein M0655_11620 [Gordonia amicalis]
MSTDRPAADGGLKWKKLLGVIMDDPGKIRMDERENPTIQQPTNAIIKIAATSVRGSDLWQYRGIEDVDGRRG